MLREQNDLPYRSPVTASQPNPTYSKNEEQYDTLQVVRKYLKDSLDGLSRDFNLFDVLSEGTDEAKKNQMMRQIAGNQIAFSILTTCLDAVEGAIKSADDNYKKRNNQ